MIFLAAQPIVDVLEEHIADLGALLERRAGAVRSPGYRPRDLRMLDARVAAHADALVLAGIDAVPLLADTIESSDDSGPITAAALALVDGEDPRVDLQPFLQALAGTPPAVFRAVGRGVLLARPRALREALAAVARGGPVRAAVVATLALAGTGDPGVAVRLPSLLVDGDALAREAGWIVLAALTWGGRSSPEVPPHSAWAASLRADCESDAPELRDAALVAAVMTRQAFLLPWVLERGAAGSRPDVPMADLGAALARPDALPLVLRLLARRELGLGRFQIAASFGAPPIVEALLDALAAALAPVEALAAHEAFQRITGLEAAAGPMVRVPADWRVEPAEIDEDLLEEVAAPDAASARARWQVARASAASATRLWRGLPMPDRGVEMAQHAALDMRALWQDLLRASYHGAAPAAHPDFWHTLQPLG